MKTLKKSLALVLAVVMALSVLGVLAVPASADYSDADEIVNVEAVDVLTGINAIEGVDGAFLPQTTMTRATAAGIIARLLLTRSVADSLPKTCAKFTDVEDGAWFAGYVSYCVSMNIINGATATTFDPDGLITDVGFLKLLLGALGYNDNGELTGSMWMVNTLAKAIPMGLTKGETADVYDEPACRDCMAQYAFNALLYTPTATTKTVTQYVLYAVTTPGTELGKILGTYYDSINEGRAAVDLADETDGGSPVYGVDYNFTPVSVVVPVYTGSIQANTYPSLAQNTAASDDLGRPANVWKFGSPAKNISVTTNGTLVAAYTTGFSQYDLYKLIGASGSIDTKINNATGTTGYLVSANTASSSTTKANSVFNTNGGNGVITEIYKVDNTGAVNADYVAVMIQPTFGTITDIVTTRATAVKGAYNTYYVDGTAAGIIYTSVVDAKYDVDTLEITGAVAKGDKVLYYKGTNGHYISAVDTISGIVSSVTSAGVITIGSTKTAKAEAAGALAVAVNATTEQTYYVDSYGYILGAKSAAYSADVALILGADSYSVIESGKIVTEYTATIANLDGSISTVPINGTEYLKWDTLAELDTGAYTYSVDSDGYYSFTKATTSTNTDGTHLYLNIGVTKVTNKTSALTGGSHVTLASTSTKFVVANYAWSNAAQARVPTGTVTVYTGINNVPTFESLTKTTAVSYSSGTADQVAETVFIFDDVYATASSPYIYVLGSYNQTGTNSYVLDVIIDGEYDTITVNAAGLTELLTTNGAGLYSDITLNGTAVSSSTKATAGVKYARNNGNLLFTGASAVAATYASASIANDVPVYTIYADGSVSTGTAADLASGLTVTDPYRIYAVDLDGVATTIEAVYVTIETYTITISGSPITPATKYTSAAVTVTGPTYALAGDVVRISYEITTTTGISAGTLATFTITPSITGTPTPTWSANAPSGVWAVATTDNEYGTQTTATMTFVMTAADTTVSASIAASDGT